MNWLEIDHDGHYRIINEGLFYMPMVQRCISNDRNDELRATVPAEKPSLGVLA